ncbi:hypothetical protein M9Y10_025576 [Tritrichomonas musculus]|uniref:Protein kinase domain-containing protein n=1 Tax=Tritrichomonas musculus TaxID=1915356 RepID=A0ABR2H927_9EUKA
MITSKHGLFSCEFTMYYSAPEINSDSVISKCGIYSLGQIIYFIMKGKNPVKNEIDFGKYFFIQDIYIKCTKKDPTERPTITDLLLDFYLVYYSQMKSCDSFSLYSDYVDNIYHDQIIKTIKIADFEVNEKYISAFNKLGHFYYSGQFIKDNINKAIYYFSLAAEQNKSAILIYDEGKYVPRDIHKAIQYFSQAAKLNYARARLMLRLPYDVGKKTYGLFQKIDYLLPYNADTEGTNEQFMIGFEYYSGKNVKYDIDKAMYFFKRSAKQDCLESELILGTIYLDEKHKPQNLNKSIKYFLLAEKHNNHLAQYYLGIIYFRFPYNDLTKAVHFLTLSANNNNPHAQLFLGHIYMFKKWNLFDMEKAIHYFQLAANQNMTEAQYTLYVIFSIPYYVPKDMSQAIYYCTKAADINHSDAQHFLEMHYLYKKDIFKYQPCYQ